MTNGIITQNGNKSGWIGMIIQGGAVGIAILSVYFMYTLASEHIAKNTEVLIRLEGAIENNTAATYRLERTIDRNEARGTTLILKKSSL